MFEISFLPILFAGIVSAVIGFVWYHPRVFGTAWMRYSGITPETLERGKKKMPAMALIALLASILSAFVLNKFGISQGVFDVSGAIGLALISWLGFIAPVLLGTVLWEQKPLAYYLINAFYWLVALIAMSAVLVIA